MPAAWHPSPARRATDASPSEPNPPRRSLWLEEGSGHVSVWLLQHLSRLVSQRLAILEAMRIKVTAEDEHGVLRW